MRAVSVKYINHNITYRKIGTAVHLLEITFSLNKPLENSVCGF